MTDSKTFSADTLRYYDCTREEHESCKTMIEKNNRKTAYQAAVCGSVIFAVLGILGFATDFLAVFRLLYLSAAVCMLLSLLLLKKTHLNSSFILYFQMISVYAFSTGLALAYPDERGTVSLIVMPMLSAVLIDRFDRLATVNCLTTIVYSILIYMYKAPRLVSFEIFSMIVSFLLSLVFHYLIQCGTMKRMLAELRNQSLIEQLRTVGKALRFKAEKDGLTGILNRSAMVEQVQYELNCSSHGESALCIIDIDNFKAINDNYGHQCGDDTLIAVSEIIRKSFRNEDIVGRLGGDEFMVYLKSFEDEQAIIERIEGLHEHLNRVPVGNVKSLSISIGAAIVPHHPVTFDSLYKQADDALYDAKRNGKNQFRFAGR